MTIPEQALTTVLDSFQFIIIQLWEFSGRAWLINLAVNIEATTVIAIVIATISFWCRRRSDLDLRSATV